MCRQSLDSYDTYRPLWMRRYLSYSGWHFTKDACCIAVSYMRKKGKDGKEEKMQPMKKEDVDNLLAKHSITLQNNIGYDYVYIANMCLADFMGESVPDEQHMALYIKNVIDDIDAGDGEIMREWYAKMVSRGIYVDWELMCGETDKTTY